LFFNERRDVLGGEAPAFADFASAHVNEPDAPRPYMGHERFHAQAKLSRCCPWGE
jgi:hypothetical protein